MLRPRRGFPAHRVSGLIIVCGLVLSLGAVGCGVPISDAEVSATASAVAQQKAQDASSLAAGASSLNSQATLAAPQTPTPLSTLEAQGSTTPGPEVTATPEGPTPTPAPTETPPGSLSPAEAAAQVIQLVNAKRTEVGLKALTFNINLTANAGAFARDMGENNYFPSNHVGRDGSTSASRAAASGYDGAFCGEAIAAGQQTPQAVVNTWLASSPHAAILLSQRPTEVGVGFHATNAGYYRFYWVLVTGRPGDSCPAA